MGHLHRISLVVLLAHALCAIPAAAQQAPVETQAAVSAGSGQELSADALASQVLIRRDQWGIPHVLGESIEAAVFGNAYAQAEAHILRIMRKILQARGEMAEHFGAEEIESDFLNRRDRVHDGAADRFPQLQPENQRILHAFAAGMNLYIRGHREELPGWVASVDGTDILAIGRAGTLGFVRYRARIDQRLQMEPIREGQESASPPDLPGATFGDAPASNMWALAPERSTSGNAILMGNPHLPWSSVYYEFHMTVPGELNVYGAASIGSVVPSLAFNDYLGWSHTVNYPAIEDIYVLRLDPENADHYLLDGASVPLREIEIVLKVKENGSSREERRVFWDSGLGPVIRRTEDRIWVNKSPVLSEVRFGGAILKAKARDFEQFTQALRASASPMFNVAFADREGNIFYQWQARLPVRPAGRDGLTPVAVSGAEDVWSEIHPLSAMPSLLNPPGGYVQNSNAPPWLTNLNQKIDPDDFPSYMPGERLSLRTQHSLELIHNRKQFSLEEVVELKHSQRMLIADRIRDDLVAAVEAMEDAPDELLQAGEFLAAWDGTTRRESRGGVLFETWWLRYRESTSEVWRVAWNPEEPISTPRGLGDAAAGLKALSEAIVICKENHGSIDVAWGEVHRARRGSVDLPVGGGGDSLGSFRVLRYGKDQDGKLAANYGDFWVFAVEFSDPPRAFSILSYGQSEKEGSVHYADQLPLFADNRLKPVNFTEEDIAANLVISYHPGER